MKRLDQIFTVTYGVNLEFYRLTVFDGPGSINYVSRTKKNNGVSARVQRIAGLEPNPANTLSIALTGSVLEVFLQEEEYYSGRDIAYLTPVQRMDKYIMLMYCTLIRQNQYKYSYGRGANTTVGDILLPEPEELEQYTRYSHLPDITTIPDYFLNEGYEKACWYLDNVDQEVFEREYACSKDQYKIDFRISDESWTEFPISGDNGLFDIMPGKRLTKAEQYSGVTPFLGATKYNNGITGYISEEPLYYGPCLTVNYNGSVAEAYYQCGGFWNSDDVKAWIPRYKFNVYIAMFLIVIIRLQQQHFFYGRKWSQESMENTLIRLPFIYEKGKKVPDWDYMERYIRSLQFSGNIER